MKITKLKHKLLSILDNNLCFEDKKNIKSKFIGKKGIFNILIKFVSFSNKKKLNKLKLIFLNRLKSVKNKINSISLKNFVIFKNYNQPIIYNKIIRFKKDIENFFEKLKFKVFEGMEIQNIERNFEFLRIKKKHPSRSHKDTFYIKNFKNNVLRTHMTCLQKKYIRKNKCTKLIFSGKVYRRDRSPKHLKSFHQIDGLILKNKKIDFFYFRKIFESFLNEIFKKHIYIRYRNSNFPFTSPSYEIDIKKKKK
ncbi:tRNA ligase subunit PheS family protein [Candidatus Vidania fulgoroideorum]